MRLWEKICKDSQGFTKLWERIPETLDFGRGFHETLGEDL